MRFQPKHHESLVISPLGLLGAKAQLRINRSQVKTIMFKPLHVAHFVASVRALIGDEPWTAPAMPAL